MKSKEVNIPQVNLKGGDFYHEVPEDMNFELVIEYKKGDVPRDFINPVESFSVVGDLFKVTNRISDYVYNYPIKTLRRAFLINI